MNCLKFANGTLKSHLLHDVNKIIQVKIAVEQNT